MESKYKIEDISAMLQNGESIVVFDTVTGVAKDKLWQLCLDNGYSPQIFNLANPQKSNSWNPIPDFVAHDSSGQINWSRLETFGNLLTENLFPDADNIVQSCATIILNAAITCMDFLNKDLQHQITVRNIIDFLSDNAYNKIDATIKILPDNYNIMKCKWMGVNKWSNFAEINSVITAITDALGHIFTPEIEAIMSNSEIELCALGAQKSAVFCILPENNPYKVISAIFFCNVVYGTAVSYDSDIQRIKHPQAVNVLCDEYHEEETDDWMSDISADIGNIGHWNEFSYLAHTIYTRKCFLFSLKGENVLHLHSKVKE